MSKKHLYILPLVLLEIIIQLGFFWMAPNSEGKWYIYTFLTILTSTHLALSYLLVCQYGVRKSMATIYAGSIVQGVNILLSALLLGFNTSTRSILFLMLMVSALYFSVVAILWISIEGMGESSHAVQNENYEEAYEEAYEEPYESYGKKNRSDMKASKKENYMPEKKRILPPPPVPVNKSVK